MDRGLEICSFCSYSLYSYYFFKVLLLFIVLKWQGSTIFMVQPQVFAILLGLELLFAVQTKTLNNTLVPSFLWHIQQ